MNLLCKYCVNKVWVISSDKIFLVSVPQEGWDNNSWNFIILILSNHTLHKICWIMGDMRQQNKKSYNEWCKSKKTSSTDIIHMYLLREVMIYNQFPKSACKYVNVTTRFFAMHIFSPNLMWNCIPYFKLINFPFAGKLINK